MIPPRPRQRATSEFKMVASFVPEPGMLPRLRFGNTYRIRARVVDLAGNSLAHDAPDPADFSKATAPHLYTRFEPVVAPLAVLTKTLDGTKSPGESLSRPVIRSNYDKSAPDYASLYGSLVSDPDYTGFALRLIAPPKTSQLMAERHSMFDSPSGAMKKDQATYQMIASKAEGAFLLDPTTRAYRFKRSWRFPICLIRFAAERPSRSWTPPIISRRPYRGQFLSLRAVIGRARFRSC